MALGATKTDIRGEGEKRRHETIRSEDEEWGRACPVQAIREQLKRREEEGAGPEDPLFPDEDGNFPTRKVG